MRRFQAFTLIELLIVVAIIAILAAIAVPNMLEAQTRTKVSRCKADLRSLALAIECYRTDNQSYPNRPAIKYAPVPGVGTPLRGRLAPITTPVSYMETLPVDVFNPGVDVYSRNGNNVLAYGETRGGTGAFHPEWLVNYARATGFPDPAGIFWVAFSYGPVRDPLGPTSPVPTNNVAYTDVVYDPTNGTISTGIIVRVGG
jgi:type II secretion system protein G